MARRKEEKETQGPQAPEEQVEAGQPADETAAAADETVPAADETAPATDEAPLADAAQAEVEADAEAEVPGEAEALAGEEPSSDADQEGAPETTAGPEPAAEPTPTLVELSADARYSATGKRKSSIARVILRPGSGGFDLNGRTLDTYFPRKTLQEVVRQPLKASGYADRIDVRAKVHGGGISSQADAIRHGIAKALIDADPQLRTELKRRQLLTRDPRVKERRKAGLKKARKRPQFSKR